MEQGRLLSINIVPSEKHPYLEQCESGVWHTSYAQETAFYSLIQRGAVEEVQELVEKYMSDGVFVGKLSDDPIKQMRYWTICCITLGIRYAIQGGLDESRAYNLSDEYIRSIDRMEEAQQILNFVRGKVVELTRLVRASSREGCPRPVRLCLDYVDRNICGKIALSDLSELTGLSEDYISRLFKKHVGQSFRDYVLSKRLDTAKSLLRGDVDQKLVAYYLGFCSQTYFITCFKKAYGTTPHQYAMKYNAM